MCTTVKNHYREYNFDYNGTLTQLKEGLEKATDKMCCISERAFTGKFIYSGINDDRGIGSVRIYANNSVEFRLKGATIPYDIWEKTVVNNIIAQLKNLGASNFKLIA